MNGTPFSSGCIAQGYHWVGGWRSFAFFTPEISVRSIGATEASLHNKELEHISVGRPGLTRARYTTLHLPIISASRTDTSRSPPQSFELHPSSAHYTSLQNRLSKFVASAFPCLIEPCWEQMHQNERWRNPETDFWRYCTLFLLRLQKRK